MRWRPTILRWAPALILFAAFYFSIDALELFAALCLRLPAHVPQLEILKAQFHTRAVTVAAMVYGLFRVAAFHPLYRVGYGKWLRSTPWHAGLPLPLGPVTLAWRDVPVLGAMAALAYWNSGSQQTALPLLTFACAYLAASALALVGTLRLVEAYLIALGAALVAWLWFSPWLALVVAATLIMVAQFGLRRSLRDFPWDNMPRLKLNVSPPPWPTDIPKRARPLVSPRIGIAIASLVAVWVAVIVDRSDVPRGPASGMIVMGPLVGLIGYGGGLIRICIYCGNLWPPVNFIGRITSGRLILPRYDYVFIAPLTAMVVGAVLPRLLAGTGLPTALCAAATAWTILVVLLLAGPHLRMWQLTGWHRAVQSRAR